MSSSTLLFFRSFISRDERNNRCDATDVFSADCYKQWLSVFGKTSTTPEQDFSERLLSHVKGTENKAPFSEAEETAILIELSKNRVWPCFESSKTDIGKHALYPLGYHQSMSVENRKLRSSKRKALINNKQGLLEESSDNYTSPNRSKQKNKYLSSYEVFLQFTDKDANGCSRILSKDCFQTWVETRRHGVKNAEHSFRKALIAHLCGKDGRRPFPPTIEPSVVAEIRKKRIWPCFIGNKDPRILNIGNKGFRHLAYHEGKLAETDSPELKVEEIDFKATKARKSVRRSASAYEMRSCPKYSAKRRKTGKSQSLVMTQEYDFLSSSSEVGLDRSYSQAELVIEPIRLEEELDFSESDYISWDLESFAFNNLFEVKMCEDTENVLHSFEGVTSQEIIKVNKVKERACPIFEAYFLKVERMFGIALTHDNAVDITGDVKILQFLRVAENSVTKTVMLIEDYLKWREAHKVEELRIQLLKDDPSIEDIRKSFVLGKFGGCQPFAKQVSNGDFVALWQLKENSDLSTESMRKRVEDHIVLNEYRNLVMNRLSYKRRRVVQYSILWDCATIRAENSCEKEHCSKHVNWLRALKDMKHYIDSVNDMTWKWYGGLCKEVYVFGKGYLFRALTMLVFKTILSKYAAGRVKVCGQAQENKEVIERILEDNVDVNMNLFQQKYSDANLSQKSLSVLSSLSRKL